MSTTDEAIITSTTSDEDDGKATCGICRRQYARYTCPTCGMGYCGLACFRAPAHASCAEPFYQREIASAMPAPGKDVDARERRRMMEMLQRLEEDESLSSSLSDDDEGEEDADGDLARRLADVDLDAASAGEILARLTPAERGRFKAALDDPHAEVFASAGREPWFASPSSASFEAVQEPAAADIPEALIKPSPNLRYNLVALCIAYAYTLRHLSAFSLGDADLDTQEAWDILSKAVPLLVDRSSRTVFPHVDAVVTDIWARLDPNNVTGETVTLLLRDAAALLKPRRVAELSHPPTVSSIESHPNSRTARALSDVSALFDRLGKKGASRKAVFYAGMVLGSPVGLMDALTWELESAAAAQSQSHVKSVEHSNSMRVGQPSDEGKTLRIEEVL